MLSAPDDPTCDQLESVALFVLQALPSDEAAQLRAHLETCTACRSEHEALRAVGDAFASWPIDARRPSSSLWLRLADRIAQETGRAPAPTPSSTWDEPPWREVAPGITCKVLATDSARVTMMVRLAPGAEYPPHRHAGVEELHLLDGELWIDGRKLVPGDYSRAEPGTRDDHVWSETGCMCVLITSPQDVLG